MRRRLGLTADAPSLLKTVGSRPRKSQKAPVDDDAPPMSTDGEDDDDTFSEGTVQAAKASDRSASPKRKAPIRPLSPIESDFASSADERSQRASIKPTTFASKKKEDSSTATKRRRVSTSPERPKPKERLKPGNHLSNKYGFVRGKTASTTYGKKPTGSQSRLPGWSPRQIPIQSNC